MDDLTSAFLLPAARKRAFGVRDAELLSEFILGQSMPDVPAVFALFYLLYRHSSSAIPKFPIEIFELQLTKLFIHHQTAFSF